MAGYIKVDKTLSEDPRVVELAEKYADWIIEEENPSGFRDAIGDASLYAVTGLLVTLWCYADTHIRDDDSVTLSVTSLSRFLRFPEKILRQFPPEWLQVKPDGTVILPNYRSKNSLITRDKRKELAKERTRRWRAKKANGDASGDGVTVGGVTASQGVAYPSSYSSPSTVSKNGHGHGFEKPSMAEAEEVCREANPRCDPATVAAKWADYVAREGIAVKHWRAHLRKFAKSEHFSEDQWASRKAQDSRPAAISLPNLRSDR